ncbi:cytochrome c [Arenibacter sp. GZD96]|uniref:c-type cytochrome n=1 Tax=Aurantibrevibacter litoralis TaxID=3106030 RepID=UPI002AFDF7C6|nr:cytochrome c [Arenibacter sp. GZD-96]MEA1787348.1 cytochrome c [Arenibacter sp. GZD-96]
MKKILVLVPLAGLLLAFTSNIDYGNPNTSYYQDSPWKAPASAKAIKNPVAANKVASSAKKGKATFTTYCVVCHGAKGIGDGAGGKALDPKPANLTSDKVQGQTDGEIFWKITNGRGAMVKWEAMLSETQRWELVNYVRTLKK